MQNEKVRRVTVDNGNTNPMNYVVGNSHPIPQDGSNIPLKLIVSSIEETKKHFLVYLKHTDDTVQLWKKVPKNKYTTPEYFID